MEGKVRKPECKDQKEENIMRERKISRIIGISLSTALLAGIMAGCGTSKSSGSTETTAKGGAGELNLFVWTEYVPDSVISEFEKETGIKVNVSTYSDNEDMLAKVKSETEGTYDVVLPSDYMVESMIEQGMLEKLDQSKLTNLSNIGTAYLDPSYDPKNVYSVPYQGGVVAIAVNTSKVKRDIESYGDLFDPDLKGSMVVLDDYRAIIGVTARSLGYSMNETDTTKIKEISDKLMTLKDNVKLYDSDSPKSALISGDCTVGCIWSAEIALAMAENPDIKIVFPKEGPYVFMDNWCITKGAKNYDNAMNFINYMLDPKTAEAVSAEFPYLQPNETAVKAMGTDYSDNPAKNPPADVISSGEYVKELDNDTLTLYNDMWNKLKQ